MKASKRFCQLCGVERPVTEFGLHDKVCSRDHSVESFEASRSRSSTKSERRKQRKKAKGRHPSYAGKVTVETYQVNSRRRQFTKRILFGSNGWTQADYTEYLQSEHWQQFKAAYRAQGYLHECLICGDKQYDLHHIFYGRLGHEEMEDVIPLCRRHHKAVHQVERQGHPLRYAHLYVKQRFLENQTR